DPEQRVVAVVLISTILLAVGLALGFGIQKARSGGGSASASNGSAAVVAAPVAAADVAALAPAADVATATPAETAAVAAPSMDDASVVIENGVVKFYFASGKADLASGALGALGDAIDAA